MTDATIYDFVIIGSGLGGLECGLILAKEGYSVCILEKNHQIGGSLQVFSRDKSIFDTGVHYISGLDRGQNLDMIFRYLGIRDELKLRKMDEDGFDRITFDNDPMEYCYAQGYEKFEKGLIPHFPEEAGAIRAYIERIQWVCEQFPLYNLRYEETGYIDEEMVSVGAKDFIDSLTGNQKLRNVLAGTNPLYAGYADKTPFYIHALIINTYVESSYRCVDGGSQIAKLLTRNLHQHGGKVIKHQEVVSFEFIDDLVEACVTREGERFYGRNFIANIHPQVLVKMLGPGKLRKAYVSRIESLENTISSFIVHIACKPETFPYLNYNYYHYAGDDVWSTVNYDPEKWPESYMFSTPACSKSPEFADSITIMAYMHTSECDAWKESFHTVSHAEERGLSYEEFKREKEERVIKEVEKKFPQIRECIRSVTSSTPLTFRDYIGNNDGSLYGVLRDYAAPLKTFLTPKTKIPNMFLTGQNINLHGVLGVSISSIVTCSEFIDRKKLVDAICSA